ncbi:MAG: DNA-processing protein DprA [Deltaproteobacteria bacterium]|nr:DNA-processing protein DprA [Deltaproteobacteria bacterium]
MNRFWLALSYLDGKGVGPAAAAKLVGAFGTPEAVFRQKSAALREAGASEKAAAAITEFRDWKPIDDAEKSLSARGAAVVPRGDAAYPAALAQVDHPPAVLYVVGSLRDEDNLAVSVVGTRKPTDYGLRSARTLARQAAECGVCVVSGLARGIDTAAHEGALEAPNGRTVAVLGSGVDYLYPSENAGLARKIAERGAVLSEFFPGTPPKPENFPRRNRIIAGLGAGVLVVEAGDKSGTMITVDAATRQESRFRRPRPDRLAGLGRGSPAAP